MRCGQAAELLGLHTKRLGQSRSANKEEWPGRSAIWSVQDESGREAAPSPELTEFVGQRAKKRKKHTEHGHTGTAAV